MPQVVDRYNDWIVLLSVFIAVTSAYTAFDLMDWVLFKNRKSLWWTFLISFALGIGIWSMHFIGMLAMKTVISVTYEPSMLLISLFLPILASFFAMLLVFIDRSISRIQFILSGFLITMAIVSMHFAGMLSMNVPLLYRQSAYPMVLSVIIVLLASYSGLYLGIYRSERRTFSHLTLPKIMGALILGLAVSGMHYTALAGTTFNALDRNHSLSGTGVNSTLLAIMVSAATLLIISFILTGLYLDRREVLYSARFNEKRYMTLFELNPDLVICVDPKKQRILSVNPAVLANTGYTAEEVMALPLESLFWSRRDHLIMLSAVQRASEGNPRQVEIRMKNKLGEMVIQSATLFPLDTQRQQLLYIITKDVTEQRLSEKELLAAKEAAESAARMKSEFLATMSHELRTPLNGIIGINQLLADGEEDEGRRELLELQSKSSHALLNVINDILDLSKMEAGKVKLVREKFSIRSLIEECYDLFEVISRDKAIAMRFYLNPDVPDTVIGDQMRLRQILVNLIGNALKFTDEGFISLTVKKIGRDNGRYTLEFNVTDTGIGIEPDKVELLFKPFSQLDGAQHRKYEGTGLGLAICRKLVEMMNGEIWVVPEVAKGAQFAFRIQLDKNEDELTGGRDTDHECAFDSDADKLRVLLAENGEVNRRVTAHMLDKLGCSVIMVTAAGQLTEALHHRGAYDLILLNIDMPGLNRLSWDDTPPEIGLRPYVAAMTTQSAEEHAALPISGEFIDVYVEKPIDMRQLQDIVVSVRRLRHLPLKSG